MANESMTKLTKPTRKIPSLLVGCSVLLLVACGESDDNAEYNYKDQDNLVINMNIFDIYTHNNSVTAISRNMTKMRDGSLMITKRPIYRALQKTSKPQENTYYIGSNFTRIVTNKQHPAEFYDVTGVGSYNDTWQDSQSGKQVTSISYQYIPVNISGVVTYDNNVVNSSNYANNKTKIIQTILNVLPKTKGAPLPFPQGARCYVLETNISEAYFEFTNNDIVVDSDNAVIKENTIREWKEKYTNHVEANYGSDNTTKALYAVNITSVTNTVDKDITTYQNKALVEYDNTLYQATYHQAVDFKPNHDVQKGAVKCTSYNNVAADFMELLISKAYK